MASDGSWKVTVAGPTRYDSYYLGETYDARREIPGWNQPGFDDSAWAAARVVSEPAGVPRAQAHEPIAVVGTRPPGARSEPVPGVVVYDVGQNLTGWAEIRVDAPAGTAVEVFYSEKLGERRHGPARSATTSSSASCRPTTTWRKARATSAGRHDSATRAFSTCSSAARAGAPLARGRVGLGRARSAGANGPRSPPGPSSPAARRSTGSTGTPRGRSRATCTASSPTPRSTRRTPGRATRSSPREPPRSCSTPSGSTGRCSRTCSTRRPSRERCRSWRRATRTTATWASRRSSRSTAAGPPRPGTRSGS